MKKRLAALLALALTVCMMAGCGSTAATQTTAQPAAEEKAEEETEDKAEETTEEAAEEAEETSEEATEETSEETSDVVVRVGALKGPTSMGLVGMMDEDGYEFTMETAADALVADVAGDKVDIALVPANVASVLYNKTEGGVSVIDINTLSVLNVVSADDSIKSVADLAGKTIYLTGKGTTPDYALQYVLRQNQITEKDVTLEYKSEATEVASVLAETEGAIGLLPQPFVTAALMQNDKLHVCFALGDAWDEAQKNVGGESKLVTGVTIVNNDFLAEHEDLVQKFLEDHEASAAYTNENVDEAAEKIAELGIVAKAPIAKKAIPGCSITFIQGAEMKKALSGYLEVLADMDPTTVGGKLPADDFYYNAD